MRKSFQYISGILLTALPVSTYASGPANMVNPCPVDGLSCPANIVDYVFGIIGLSGSTVGIISAFIGILAAMLMYYGFRLLIEADNESTTNEVKMAYGHALTGAILVGGSGLLAQVFASTSDTSATFIDIDPGISLLEAVILTFKGTIYTALVFNISFQGIRLVMHQDESQADKAKKQFLYGIFGAMVVILADAFVSAFVSRNVVILSQQTIGITEFLLTILGGLAVIAIFVAGAFLVLSLDESLKERAKKTILASIVVLTVVILSLSIMMIFVQAPLS